MKITPIGSCRIATPLRLGRDDLGFTINTGRIYGFSHSSCEAVQQMRFLQGDYTPAPEVWPLIAPGTTRAEKEAEIHKPSDAYIVEVCSSKTLALDGEFVQLNYLRRGFADFFADAVRTRDFMRLCRSGDRADMRAFLQTTWSDTLEKREEAEVLGRLKLQFCDTDMLKRDLASLREGLGNVLIVSHVDAQLPNGESLQGRSAFIRQVAETAKALDLPFCNPTDAMQRMGQCRAIADASTSLAHYTDGFARALVRDWHRDWL